MKRKQRSDASLRKLASALAECPANPRPGFATAWREAIQKLPERTRVIMEERYGESLSYAQIAARHGITKQRVHQILVEALASLRSNQKLREQIEECPVAVLSALTQDDIELACDYQRTKAAQLWQNFLASLSQEQTGLLREYRQTMAAVVRLKRWLERMRLGKAVRNAHEIAFYLPQS